MATKTTTQAGPISDAATFGGSAFNAGDNLVVNHALTIDVASICGNSPIGAPQTAPILTKTAGGALSALTYFVAYTHVDAGGNESDLTSTVISLATDATNNRLVVTLPTLPSGVSSYNIYALTSGATYFRQLTGVSGGANNIDTFSSVTAYAPIYACRVNNANGRLIINANLTCKGSVGLDGTTVLTDVIVTQAAGTVVEFDASAAPNTTFGYQVHLGGFTNARKSIFWKINGTGNSRCALRSNAGGGNAYFVARTTETGIVDWSYVDITRMGTAALNLISIAGGGTFAVTINLIGCIFDTCGRFGDTISMNVATNFTVQNTTWKNTLHATECFRQGSTATPVTGVRIWSGNVADKSTIFSLAGLTLGGSNTADVNIFLNMPLSSGTSTRTPAASQNNFFRYTGVSSAFRLGDWLENVMVVDGNTYNGSGSATAKADLANPHWTTPTGGTNGTYLVTSCIFESFGADDTGDVDYGPNTASGNSSFSYCIGVPEDTNIVGTQHSVGTLVTLNGFSGASCKYNHNTWFVGGQGAIALAEIGTGFAGCVDELQSNIFWNNDRGAEGSATFNRITYEPSHIASLSAGGIVANMVNVAKCGHNCRYRLFTGSGTDAILGPYTDGGMLGHSYHHYSTIGTFGTTDVTADPQFVDVTVRFWTWVKSIAGATLPGIAVPDRKDYQAWGLYKLSLKNEPLHVDYDSRYTLVAYKTFIRAGFTPSNTALLGMAHDGTDIGAMTVVPENSGFSTGALFSVWE